MPALTNAKHERFAQELAKGKTADEAYQEAGYAENRHNASRLKTNEHIGARVAELLEGAAARTEITVASITKRLLDIATVGEKSTEAPLLAVARASLMDAAKLNGLVVEKREHSGPDGGPMETKATIDPSSLNADQLRALASIPVRAG